MMSNESAKKHNGVESTQRINCNNSERSANSSSIGGKARKRKRCEISKLDSDLESELDCNLEDAIAIEKKLRKIAKDNSLSDDEMHRLLQKFVKNEHILALVTLQAEDELARERQNAEQPAIIITDTPSVPKLTRARARELNKTPSIALSSLTDTAEPEIASLIKDDLHSDDEDEEYIFKEEDFVSDDDPNTTISDLDSNPCTPQTPMSHTEDSPVKFTSDGCFKIPLEKNKNTCEDLRIAARTRSKLCLQQTAIEDIESEFVPPDVDHIEMQDTDLAANDEDWMQFLNDFTKPLNTNFVTDDDDPINDPEYIAADKITEDAEELRDINIPKKELAELVAELFEGLLNEGVSLESVEIDTPNKMLQNQSDRSAVNRGNSTSNSLENTTNVSRVLNFDTTPQQPLAAGQPALNDSAVYPANLTQDYSFHPNMISTPATSHLSNVTHSPMQTVPVAYTINQSNSICQTISVPSDGLNNDPEWIAIKIPGQSNTYQLARVITGNALGESVTLQSSDQTALEQTPTSRKNIKLDSRYNVPHDNNFTWEYISIKKHVYTEYYAKFESLRHLPSKPHKMEELPQLATGFTKHQHDIFQQQLRIHVQMLTQTFLQTYSHPSLWKLAPQAKGMLIELHEKAKDDESFNAWNLNGAVQLVDQWESELGKDTVENKEMMRFIHKEIDLTNRNTRQVPRFAPRLMDFMLDSEVFMYPQYLPRIPFTPKTCFYQSFSPAEAQLIAMGLEKHITRIRETCEQISKKNSELTVACDRLCKDTVFGKTKRRVWRHIKALKKAKYYNPVKYFFEHNCAPPLEHNLLTFECNRVLPPKYCYHSLPLAWQSHLNKQNQAIHQEKTTSISPPVKVSREARENYLEFVREALGEDIQLPEELTEASGPDGSVTEFLGEKNNTTVVGKKCRSRRSPNSVTINVNYVFGGTSPIEAAAVPSSIKQSRVAYELNCTSNNLNTSTNSNDTLPHDTVPINIDPSLASVVSFNYDYNTQTLRPNVELRKDVSSTVPRISAKETVPVRRKLFPRKHTQRLRYFKVCRKNRGIARRHRTKRSLQKYCTHLFLIYLQSLEQEELRYSRSPVVSHYYRNFKALELYSDLLIELKMTCRNSASNVNSVSSDMLGSMPTNMSSSRTFASSAQFFGKRTRSQLTQQQVLEDEANIARNKRSSRQEENLRNMLLPESAEDVNRKDAIYAFNFYEKVEEAFKSSNRPEDCKRFNYILKSFDPRRDKVADLYYKLEQLFLPEHPELAEVFLTFMLPSEATEIGKFFEHFMVTNMGNFINKLNTYFNKQPAQMRKIYNSLNELAQDPDVTIKKVEAKILPLLKGNQFLIDWFVQQFSEEPPPDRLFAPPERVNLKEVQSNARGEFFETVIDPMETILSNEQQQPLQPLNCQLKYINGRIFYGNKMTLPAKLSFMATNYQPEDDIDADSEEGMQQLNDCVHGIREYGERRLATAAANEAAAECNSDDNEKSEEDEICKALIIDINAEDDSSTSIEPCDEATLRAHATRLNPNYYANTCFATITSTPNPNTNQPTVQQTNVKKLSLNFNDEGKVSPRKQAPTTPNCSVQSTSPTQCNSPNPSITTASAAAALLQLRDKRRSPAKKVKSPVSGVRAHDMCMQPMVVVHEQNPAIACAKKLKSLIEEENECDIDNKDRLTIVACAKLQTENMESNHDDITSRFSSPPPASETLIVTKVEHTDCSSDMEFLPEHTANSQTNFPSLKIDSDLIDEANTEYSTTQLPEHSLENATPMESDEDCKLDVVATLLTTASQDCANNANKVPSSTSYELPATSSNQYKKQISWTRQEDKLILVEMKLNADLDRDSLYECIQKKLPERALFEIANRHQFLIDFLSKLQGK